MMRNDPQIRSTYTRSIARSKKYMFDCIMVLIILIDLYPKKLNTIPPVEYNKLCKSNSAWNLSLLKK